MKTERDSQNHGAIAPELVRIAQTRCKEWGLKLKDELARLIVEEAILSMDPELGLVLGGLPMSSSDVLSFAVGVNDIVLNDRRIDVRFLGDQGEVSMSRTLIGSQYLSYGSFIVEVEDFGGRVVGFVGAGVWMKAEEQDNGDIVTIAFSPAPDFDFAQTALELAGKASIKLPCTSKFQDVKSEVTAFISGNLISARKKQIFSYILANWDEDMLAMVDSIRPFTRATAGRILSDSARWNATVELLCDKLSLSFKQLSRDEIREQVLATGEKYGAQFQACEFRKNLLSQLAASEVGKQSKLKESKAKSLLESVLSGVSVQDAVKQLVNNKVAVELAVTIRRERAKVSGFAAATAEEIGNAFQKLSLQPAYATHSSADSGVESINEALDLLAVGEIAESVKSADRELASL